jgi:hypothetical protein
MSPPTCFGPETHLRVSSSHHAGGTPGDTAASPVCPTTRQRYGNIYILGSPHPFATYIGLSADASVRPVTTEHTQPHCDKWQSVNKIEWLLKVNSQHKYNHLVPGRQVD